jgi:hypothetical protein
MRFLLLCLACVAAPGVAWAEREPEDRKDADIVVKGDVRSVYVRDEKEYYHYIVELRVDEVEKAKDVKPRDTLYVYCFKRKKDAPREPAMSGHDSPPEKGQRIKAFVKHGRGKQEAIYPNWYDRLEGKS